MTRVQHAKEQFEAAIKRRDDALRRRYDLIPALHAAVKTAEFEGVWKRWNDAGDEVRHAEAAVDTVSKRLDAAWDAVSAPQPKFSSLSERRGFP